MTTTCLALFVPAWALWLGVQLAAVSADGGAYHASHQPSSGGASGAASAGTELPTAGTPPAELPADAV